MFAHEKLFFKTHTAAKTIQRLVYVGRYILYTILYMDTSLELNITLLYYDTENDLVNL